MKNLIVSVLVILSCSFNVRAQSAIDSLNKALRTFEEKKRSLGASAPMMMDTLKADILNGLIWEYVNINSDTLPSFIQPCMEISQRCGYKKGIANALTGMGFYYNEKLNYPRTLQSHQQALAIRRELGDDKGVAYSLQQVGIAFADLGRHADALASYMESKKFAERSGDSLLIARNYMLLAGFLSMQGKHNDALASMIKAMHICENNRNGDKIHNRLYNAYTGIAGILLDINPTSPDIIPYYEKALAEAEAMGGRYYIVNTMGSIGIACREQGDYHRAIRICTEALNMFRAERLDSLKPDVADLLAWFTQLIGTSHERQGNIHEALRFMKLALPHAMRSNFTRRKEVFEELATIYQKLSDYKQAYEYHLKAVQMNDSISKSIDLQSLNRVEMQSEFSRIQDSTRAEQTKKDLASQRELDQQKLARNASFAGLAIVLVFSVLLLRQRNLVRAQKANVEREKERSESLLLNILPAEVAEELKQKGTASARQFDAVTVLFTDFKSFTTFSENLSPQDLVLELHTCFKAFDEICERYDIEKIKTIGDAYLAVCGLPNDDARHAEKVVRAAIDIRDFMLQRAREQERPTFEIRIGVNSGSVVAGIVGVKKYSYDIWGDTVNTAARMEQHSEPGKINISESTYTLIDKSFRCEYRGQIEAKNKGALKMYFVHGS